MNRYDELYEIIYQDTQWGVEYIIQLEDENKKVKSLLQEAMEAMKA